jgi:tetratricopeptide (TPR) repeat protein
MFSSLPSQAEPGRQPARPLEARLGPALPAVTLLLLTLAGYANSFPGVFLWDDWQMVVRNPLVNFHQWGLIFSSEYCSPFSNCGTYRPLTVLSYALNRRLFGTGPVSFHAANVAFHVSATLLLYAALRDLPLPRRAAWWAAAFFGLHPVHTEAVHIVTFRSETLAAAGVFLALWASGRRFRGSHLATAAAYASALLSKENGVTLPALVLLCDLFRSGNAGETLRRRLPLYGMLAGVTAVWLVVRHRVISAVTMPPNIVYPTDNPLVALDAVPRLLTALKAQGVYLAMLAWPARLQAVYTGSSIGVVRKAASLEGLMILALTCLFAAAAVWGWRRRGGFGLGLFFYAASFAVTGNFFFTGTVLVGERLAYLPSAGFCLAVSSLLAAFGSRRGRGLRRAGLAFAAGYLLVLGGLLVRRNQDFASPQRLAEVAVRRDPGNARAWWSMGDALMRENRPREAEAAFRRATAIDPAFADTYLSLSWMLLSAGRSDAAIEAALAGLKAAPQGEAAIPSYLHWVLARAHLQAGRFREAREWYDRLPPDFPHGDENWALRGSILEGFGDIAGAVGSFLRSISGATPPEAALFFADRQIAAGRPDAAEPVLARALSVVRLQLARGEDPALLNCLGMALALQGDQARARAAFLRAVALAPEEAAYRDNLARVAPDSPAPAERAPGPPSPGARAFPPPRR